MSDSKRFIYEYCLDRSMRKTKIQTKLTTYGTPKIMIRPYQLRDYLNNFKKINLLLAVVIVGLYPLPVAIGLNMLISKIEIKNVMRF